MLCHVNLIPINKVEEREYEKPDKAFIYKFRDSLEKNNIPATVRCLWVLILVELVVN